MNRPVDLDDQAVLIPKAAPRPERLVGELRVNFMSFVWKFVGTLFILTGVTNFLAALPLIFGANASNTPRSTGWFLAGFGLGLTTLAVHLLRRNRRRIQSRRRALLEGVRCPARLVSVRKRFGFNLTYGRPDFLHILDVQMPDHRIVKHELKLPLDATEQLDDRADLFVLVHLPTGDVFVPDALHHVRWTD